jgi:hypothetical protein
MLPITRPCATAAGGNNILATFWRGIFEEPASAGARQGGWWRLCFYACTAAGRRAASGRGAGRAIVGGGIAGGPCACGVRCRAAAACRPACLGSSSATPYGQPCPPADERAAMLCVRPCFQHYLTPEHRTGRTLRPCLLPRVSSSISRTAFEQALLRPQGAPIEAGREPNESCSITPGLHTLHCPCSSWLDL